MSSWEFIPFKADGSEDYSKTFSGTELTYKDFTPLLIGAISTVKTTRGQPFVIGDYGSADGVGSYDLIRTLIGFLRKRDGKELPITVIYEDQPVNHFRPIFLLSHGETAGQQGLNEEFQNVYIMACGTSFYSQCLPANSVDFLFSLHATHWLSRCPCKLENTIFSIFAEDKEKESFQTQSAEDRGKISYLKGN